MSNTIKIADLEAGVGHPLLIIAGPCVIESLEQCVQIGEVVRDACAKHGLRYIFKASFDKANRSSISSPRGPGLEAGLRVLEEAGRELGVPVTTDLHESSQAAAVGQAVDVIQIPAFLCRQTDLLAAAAATGKPVNVKKGQFMSPDEMRNVITKLTESDAAGIMLTERGTFFGYNRLVNDFIGLGDMIDLGYPVCFDVTHSTQQPGGQGTKSGGRPDRAPLLAKAATAAGVHALFIECHPDPAHALSDGATVLPLETMDGLLGDVARLRGAIA
ncbi:MAG: 3-deoxy-8-phosphooctulonate synthase [Phycisphaera sp.]|nr:3-deoxy-8-phosphooctulonate synthase [Phycisphaera sp.]